MPLGIVSLLKMSEGSKVTKRKSVEKTGRGREEEETKAQSSLCVESFIGQTACIYLLGSNCFRLI